MSRRRCCCGPKGCDLWALTLPADADPENPPEGFGFDGEWFVTEKLPQDNWNLEVLANSPRSLNRLRIWDQAADFNVLYASASSDSGNEMAVGAGGDADFASQEMVQLATPEYEGEFNRLIEVSTQNRNVMLTGLGTSAANSPPRGQIPFYPPLIRWTNSDTATSGGLGHNGTMDRDTGEVTLEFDNEREVKYGVGSSYVLPISGQTITTGQVRFAFNPDRPQSEVRFTAKRSHNPLTSKNTTCELPSICSINEPTYGHIRLVADLDVPGLSAFRSMSDFSGCVSSTTTLFPEGVPLESAASSIKDRVNMGVFLAHASSYPESTDSLSNPPIQARREYQSPPQLYNATTVVTLNEVDYTAREAVISVNVRFEYRTKGSIDPSGTWREVSGSAIRNLWSNNGIDYYTSNGQRTVRQPVYESDKHGITTGLVFYFGANAASLGMVDSVIPSSIYQPSTKTVQFQKVIPLPSQTSAPILIPFAELPPSSGAGDTMVCLTGEWAEVIDTEPFVPGDVFNPPTPARWKIANDSTSQEIALSDITLTLRNNLDVPFPYIE